jgi:exopolyphosphatase
VTASSGAREIAYVDGAASVASTCTLVAERALGGTSDDAVDASLGLLLLGVILLDSVNMSPGAGKGTARDERAIRDLLRRADWSALDGGTEGGAPPSIADAPTLGRIFPNGRGGAPDPDALFDALRSAKFDPKFWSSLSVADCLGIDYKRFEASPSSGVVSSIGLSSVLAGMDSILAREDFLRGLASFVMSSSGGGSPSPHLYGMMTLEFGEDGAPLRGLLLAGADASVVDSFADFLVRSSDAAFLEFVERDGGGGEVREFGTTSEGGGAGGGAAIAVRVFRQGNGKGSRKQVAPVLLRHAAGASRL